MIDLPKRVGRLSIIRSSGETIRNSTTLCRCDCGEEFWWTTQTVLEAARNDRDSKCAKCRTAPTAGKGEGDG